MLAKTWRRAPTTSLALGCWTKRAVLELGGAAWPRSGGIKPSSISAIAALMCGFFNRLGEPMKTTIRVNRSSNWPRSSVPGENRLTKTTKSITLDKTNSGMQLSTSDVCSLFEISSLAMTFDGWTHKAAADSHLEVANVKSKCNFNQSGTSKTA